MAPTARSPSVKVKKSAANTFQPTRVNKRSRSRTHVATRTPTKSQNLNRLRDPDLPKPLRGRTYPLTLLQDGPVNMETTPDYLIEVTQRNATDSPLLHPPAEIRNMIFPYAVSGNGLLVQRAFVHPTSKKWRDNSSSYWHGRATHLGNRRFRVTTPTTYMTVSLTFSLPTKSDSSSWANVANTPVLVE